MASNRTLTARSAVQCKEAALEPELAAEYKKRTVKISCNDNTDHYIYDKKKSLINTCNILFYMYKIHLM